jgi:hypothetical protein
VLYVRYSTLEQLKGVSLEAKEERLHREVFNHARDGFEIFGKALVENRSELAVVDLMRERREDGWSSEMIATVLREDHVSTELKVNEAKQE